LILGIVVAAAGIATIGFGIPINEFSLGTTLIIAGTTALTGGLVLIGLSAVVTELARVAEGLKTRAAARPAAAKPADVQEPALIPTSHTAQPPLPQAPPPVPVAPLPPAAVASPRQPQQPAPARQMPELPAAQARPAEHYAAPVNPSAVEVSAAAIERLRSSIPRNERPRAEPSEMSELDDVPLSPNGAAHQRPVQGRPPVAEPTPPEPRVAAEDRGGAAVEALRASRLDFLFRSKPSARATPQQPAAQPENFDAFWPADARGGRPAEPPPRTEQVERRDYAQPSPTPPQAPAHAPRREIVAAEEPAAPTILKSGVVDGMAYTLYSDGSIEAKLPQGTVRFGSIAELRAHIENNS
jgi:hypothetical protein